MNKLFESNPKIENSSYRIRLVRKKDLDDLLELYSNTDNIRYINNDDCNGDNFYYQSKEELIEKYTFWKHAYTKKWFIRLSLIDKKENKVIGVIELLKRGGYDSFKDSIVIRLDLISRYEIKDNLVEILVLLENKLRKTCKYSKIAIKAFDEQKERKEALIALNYKLSNRKMIGLEDNKEYKNYYVKRK